MPPSSCCRTCDHRNAAVTTHLSSVPQLLSVGLITLSFKAASTLTDTHSSAYVTLNTVLNNIVDAAENTTHPSRFTSWAICHDDPHAVLIVTTLSATVTSTSHSGTPAVFDPVLRFLSQPPTTQHVLLDYSVVALAAASPEDRIACDILIVNAPDARIAGAIGKSFGWDPKRSSLSALLEQYVPAGFSSPGDLIRDFWAWTELPGQPVSPASSYRSSYDGVSVLKSTNSDENVSTLRSTNSDEKNMAMFLAGDEEDEEEKGRVDDETLVMIFQWSSRADAERFKHPLQKSYGYNQQSVSPDLWDRDVANPVRQLEGIGAKVEHLKVELRSVEERIEQGRPAAPRERSGSRRLSVMASGMGERLSGFWR
ncbi:hypothetical protein BCR34DRAFT_484616 [Clohesyomyces aquaticus]|uniref:Uncharacterized protein n=1 Tax=Clohesyomyces aquaticus TaxID=1231657 RepID=A0A1Y1ZLQ1_9PLEO|nr:hypothetical protein BCR34DRAFT_484616 [Clohesyomyces aquaticus]